MPYVCELRRLAAQPAMAVRRTIHPDRASAAIVEAFAAVGRFLRENGGRPTGVTYARFLGLDLDQVRVEVGFTVAELLLSAGDVIALELPAGEVVVTRHVGPYEGLSAAQDALEAWMSANGRTAAGPAWEVYLNGPPDTTDPAQFDTDVYVPLTPANAGATLAARQRAGGPPTRRSIPDPL